MSIKRYSLAETRFLPFCSRVTRPIINPVDRTTFRIILSLHSTWCVHWHETHSTLIIKISRISEPRAVDRASSMERPVLSTRFDNTFLLKFCYRSPTLFPHRRNRPNDRGIDWVRLTAANRMEFLALTFDSSPPFFFLYLRNDTVFSFTLYTSRLK